MSPSSTSSSDPLATGATPDGSIHIPVGESARVAPGLRAFAVGVFAAAILGSAVVDTVWPAPVPVPIGLEKNVDDARRAAATWRDGSRAKLVEHDLELASRMRSIVRPKHALMLLEIFSELSSPYVLAGDDGWLFLSDRTGADLQDPLAMSLERSAAVFAAMHRRLANLGIRAVSLPLPRKCVIERAHLPRQVDPHSEFDFALVDAWRARGIETVDLLPLFESAPVGPVYERKGTHWKPEVIPLVAEEIARQCGWWVAPEERNTRVVEGRVPPRATELLLHLGMDEHDAQRLAGYGDRPLLRLAPIGNHVSDCANRLPMPSLAMGGTSFTSSNGVPCFLRHYANEPVWCLADPGTDGVAPLAAFLSEHPHARPDRLVLETPDHIVMRRAYLGSAATLLGDHPPQTPLTAVAHPEALDTLVAQGTLRLTRQATQPTPIPPASVGTTEDGVLELQLTGEVTGADIDVLLRTRDVLMHYPWRASSSRVVLPVIGLAPSPNAMSIAFRSRGASSELTLSDAQFVVSGGRRPARFAIGQVTRIDDRWTVPMSAPESDALPRHSLVWIQLKNRGPIADVRLEVQAEGRAPFVAEFTALAANASIVANIGVLQGAPLESATLSARGPLAVESVEVLAP